MLHHRPPGSVRAAIVPLPPDWRDRQARLEQQIQAASCTGAVPSLTSVGSGENQTKRSVMPTQEASSLSLALASSLSQGNGSGFESLAAHPHHPRSHVMHSRSSSLSGGLGHTRERSRWAWMTRRPPRPPAPPRRRHPPVRRRARVHAQAAEPGSAMTPMPRPTSVSVPPNEN
jgi:hypothetical protein